MPRTANKKKRTDGLYQRSITMGRKPDGKPNRKTIYAKTLKELEEKAGEFERQLRHGTLSSNENATFGELAEIWLRDCKPMIGVNTRRGYAALLKNHLLPELSAYKLKELKTLHLQGIVNRLAEDEYSEKTLKELKRTACEILELAISNDILFRNVFSKAVIPHIEKTERRPLTREEVDLVTSTYSGHRMGIPALLMLYCGLRRGELLALTRSDISLKAKLVTVNKAVYFDGNTPHVKAPKSKAGVRTVPIPDFLTSIIQDYPFSSFIVCPSANGELMTHVAFKRAWESYLHYLNIAAGGKDASRSRPKLQVINNITPHMLRHTYSTMLYDAGVDIKSAQKFMGHADIETTLKIYTHLSEQKEQQAISALNAHLNARKNLDAVKMQ